MAAPTWMVRAACRHHPNVEFVPPRPTAPAPDAVAICQTCPVRVECLHHGTEHDELGIWCGASQAERRGRPAAEGGLSGSTSPTPGAHLVHIAMLNGDEQ